MSISKITELTLLPISLVIVIIGGVVWLTQIYALANSNKTSVVEIKDRQESVYNRLDSNLNSIDRRLSRIEGKLNIGE